MNPEYYIGIDMIDEDLKQLFKYADEAYELLHDEYTKPSPPHIRIFSINESGPFGNAQQAQCFA